MRIELNAGHSEPLVHLFVKLFKPEYNDEIHEAWTAFKRENIPAP